MNAAVFTAVVAMFLGAGLSVTGVYILAGTGWALLAGAFSCFVLSAVIFRGVNGK